MAVRVGDELSTWEPVLPGVPQGSVLGPIPFLLFINDMPDIATNTIKLFAEDSKLIKPFNQTYTNCFGHTLGRRVANEI